VAGASGVHNSVFGADETGGRPLWVNCKWCSHTTCRSTWPPGSPRASVASYGQRMGGLAHDACSGTALWHLPSMTRHSGHVLSRDTLPERCPGPSLSVRGLCRFLSKQQTRLPADCALSRWTAPPPASVEPSAGAPEWSAATCSHRGVRRRATVQLCALCGLRLVGQSIMPAGLSRVDLEAAELTVLRALQHITVEAAAQRAVMYSRQRQTTKTSSPLEVR
jgi:hypothetical protein